MGYCVAPLAIVGAFYSPMATWILENITRLFSSVFIHSLGALMQIQAKQNGDIFQYPI